MEILKLCEKNFDKCMTLSEEPEMKLQFYVRPICSHLDNTTTVVLQKVQTHSKQSHMLGKTFGHFQKNMA